MENTQENMKLNNQNNQTNQNTQKDQQNMAQKGSEVNTGKLANDKEIDLDRSGVNRVSNKEQSLQNTKDVPTGGGQKEVQQQAQVDKSKGRDKDTGASQGYEGNTPDIDEKTYKFGKDGGDERKQTGGGDKNFGTNQNQRSGNLGNQQDQDDSRRV